MHGREPEPHRLGEVVARHHVPERQSGRVRHVPATETRTARGQTNKQMCVSFTASSLLTPPRPRMMSGSHDARDAARGFWFIDGLQRATSSPCTRALGGRGRRRGGGWEGGCRRTRGRRASRPRPRSAGRHWRSSGSSSGGMRAASRAQSGPSRRPRIRRAVVVVVVGSRGVEGTVSSRPPQPAKDQGGGRPTAAAADNNGRSEGTRVRKCRLRREVNHNATPLRPGGGSARAGGRSRRRAPSASVVATIRVFCFDRRDATRRDATRVTERPASRRMA